ncbi:MAG: amino acid adenylation domain-containing protein [Alteromonadaceae bacterium]|nr:amino acid adenylation domain-containing protein [Alteromonadaceae bacterium]
MEKLLKQLNDQGIFFFVEAGKLKSRAESEAITPALAKLIREHKEEIIAYLTADNQTKQNLTQAPEGFSGCTFAQKQLWTLDQIEQNQLAQYHLQSAFQLKGDLAVHLLEEAFKLVVDNHKILTTAYHFDGVLKAQSSAYDRLPFSHEQVQSQSALEHATQDLLEKPFDLSRGPMIRATLFELEPEKYVLVLVAHHIATDGRSMDLIALELFEYYDQLVSKERKPKIKSSFQYLDYAYWQDTYRDRQMPVDAKYWRNHLANIPACISLPTDKVRPTEQSFDGKGLSLPVSSNVVRGLEKLRKSSGVTLFHILQTSFAVLLHRLSSEREIIIGTPVLNRPLPELDNVVGFFANTQVIRNRIDNDESFIKLAKRQQDEFIKGNKHSGFPFSALLDELGIQRDLSHNPIFQVEFTLQTPKQAAARLASDLVVSGVNLNSTKSKVDLSLHVIQRADEVEFYWEFATDLYSTDTMLQMHDRLLRILTQVIKQPDSLISALDVLLVPEREKLLGWNTTEREFSHQSTTCGLIIEQAQHAGDTIALDDGQHQISYQALAERTEVMAKQLIRYGVRNERPVALNFERSIDMVLAIIAVQRAGGAYLPLEPSWPTRRIKDVLSEAQVELVITNEIFALDEPECRVIRFDELSQSEAELEKDVGAITVDKVQASDLAYVLFTSGSTGKPKGVMVEHRAAVNRIEWMIEEYDINSSDVVLQKTPYTFDVSVWEFFLPLIAGAKLYIAPANAHLELLQLGQVICSSKATVVHFVPSMLQLMLELHAFSNAQVLKHVICSGEALTAKQVDRFYEQVADVKLHNLYGPTEAAIDVSYTETQPGSKVISIGKPIQNIRLHVLDQYFQEVPLGCMGELFIEGCGLARGYINRLELTAERFITLNLHGHSRRMYRTGDIVMWNRKGELEYLGRNDRQVKINGIRFELSEIESAVAQINDIEQAAVCLESDAKNQQRVVCYYKTKVSKLSFDDFTTQLKVSLPHYAIPRQFVAVQSFPLSANGKLDYKKLSHHLTQDKTDSELELAKTELQLKLSTLWMKVLQLEQVGIDDNFFQLGGDSILAIHVATAAKELSLRLEAKDIIGYPTIRKLALHIQQTSCKNTPDDEVNAFSLLTESERDNLKHLGYLNFLEDAYPMTKLQQGMLYHAQKDKELGLYHDIVGTRLRIRWDEIRFRQALTEMVSCHEALRTQFFVQIEHELQLVHKIPVINIEIFTLEESDETQIKEHLATWKEHESVSDFPPDKSPWKVVVHVISDNEIAYYLCVHHALLDGWSVASFDTELFDRYWHRLNQKTYAEPSPPLLNRYYVAQELTLQDAQVSREYWQQQLRGVQLPWWSQEQSSKIVRVAVPIDDTLSDGIKAIANQLGIQEKTVLLGAHTCLISLLSGRRDTLTGNVCNGRPERAGATETLGLFLNAQPFRLDLAEKTWFEVLQEAESLSNAGLSHRHYPIANVHEATGLDFSASLFNFTRFHVYKSISKRLDVVEFDGQLQTNYKLTSEFSKNLNTDQFELSLFIDSRIFSEPFRQRIVNTYLAIFAQLIERPEQSIDFANIVKQAFQVTAPQLNAFESNETVLSRFAKVSSQYSNKTAVVDNYESLSYQQLDERSSQLAAYIQSLGVCRGDKVGLFLPAGAYSIVSIIAVLKAGAAYVPIDVKNPPQRTELIVEDANLSVLLTTSEAIKQVPKVSYTVAVDSIEASSCSLLLRSVSINPDELAYVIYTSGSTGKPKGVLVNHRPLNHLFDSCKDMADFDSQDNWVLFHSYAFDFSVWEIWGALLFGSTLYIPTDETRKVPKLFRQYILDNQISVLNHTPSAFYALMDEDIQSTHFLPLRLVILSGDKLNSNRLSDWFNKYGQVCDVVNVYGITETTVFVSEYQVVDVDEVNHQQSIIGRALPGYQIVLLDDDFCPTLPGVPGEILVGGGGVTSGYLNRPRLTAERFINLEDWSDERFYRTGDMAFYNDCGELVYIGRKDKQVKIRGYRIELGEIQTALSKIEGVQDAVVMSVRGSGTEQQLIAYISWSDIPLPVSELRSNLQLRLPNYMIPAHFQYLEEIPLTINGKVDEKLLAGLTLREERKIAPQNALESQIAIIWKKVLGISSICVETDFFSLGGNSLSAVRLVTELQNRLGKALSIKELLEHGTIRSFANYIEQHAKDAQCIAAIEPDLTKRNLPFPLTDVQQAYWLGRQGGFELGNIGTHSYTEIPIHRDYIDQIEKVWNELIIRHDMLRMELTEEGQQQILPSVPYYYITRHDGGHREALRDSMSHNYFSGTQWPLFDLRLTGLKSGDGLLHFSIDALLVDASSSMILITEFAQLLLGKVLPPLTLSFRDYVIQLQGQRSSEEYAQAKKYWCERHEQFPKGPELPTQVAPQSIKDPKFERREARISKQGWNKIKELGANRGLTPTGIVMTALTDVLAMWSANSHFALNMTLFNRQPFHPEVNQLVGDFTSLTLLEVNNTQVLKNFVLRAEKLQSQLWSDLSHRSYSGVEFQRSLAAYRNEECRYPVVLTSTLGLEQSEDLGDLKQASYDDQFGVTQTSQVWLDCKTYERQGALVIEWDSVKELFDAELLDQMFDVFTTVLNKLTNEEYWFSAVLAELPDQQKALINSVNSTFVERDFPLLHQGFVESLNDHADKLAVISDERSLSYAELDRLSLHLAYKLQSLNVRPDTLVAIVMDKSWQQVVAALAISRAGAAYLPIDASMPEARIANLLEQGQVEVAIYSDLSITAVNKKLVWLSVENYKKQAELPLLEPLDTIATNLAYVIFTSGSTGNPKGVAIDHRGAVNTIMDVNERFDVTESDVIIGLSNLNFDLSVYDIFGSLSAGATLVLPRPDETRAPDAWVRYIESYGVTIWNSVPAIMQMLVDYLTPEYQNQYLRLLMMSGDWIPTRLPAKVAEHFPDCHQVSLGGATEASIWSIYYPILDIDIRSNSIPYGKALSNQQFYVLNSQLAPVPVNVEGDLYIAGIGLAREYWRDEEKTRQSFVYHPQTGQRLYHTGDRGRLLCDGNIEFMGRRDQQVKVQGHRIELEEIEHHLERHSEVRKAVVAVQKNESKNQLVAYLVTDKKIQHTGTDDFKYQNHAIRNEGVPFTLPKREASKRYLLKPLDDKSTTKSSNDFLTYRDICNFLALYQRHQCDGEILPKALYPSAGSLYPVQIYLKISQNSDDNPAMSPLSSGYYYYNPLSHTLMKLAECRSNRKAEIEVAFIADYKAVEPVYNQKSREFCQLEAGYMVGLFSCVDRLGLEPTPSRLSAKEWKKSLGCGENYELLESFSLRKQTVEKALGKIFHITHTIRPNVSLVTLDAKRPIVDIKSRKSYRKFERKGLSQDSMLSILDMCQVMLSSQGDTPLSLIIRLHEGIDDSYSAGFYHYESQRHCLSRIIKQSPLVEELMQSGDLKVMKSAAFSLFFLASEKGNLPVSVCGQVSQALQSYLPSVGIGLCPVGVIKEEQFKACCDFNGGSFHVIHTLVGGYIASVEGNDSVFSAAPIVPDWFEFSVMLENSLPNYMVPKAFAFLDSLPLTVNGKLDRSRLPEIDLSQLNGRYVSPEGEMEKRIQTYCQNLLDSTQLSVTQNLLHAGGDSLLIVRLVNHIREHEGVSLSIADIYSAVDIRSIAERVETANASRKQFEKLSEGTETISDMEHLSL